MGRQGGLLSALLAFAWILLFVTYGVAKPNFRSLVDPLDKFNEFDWNFTKVVSTKVKGNVLLSPISLKLVLAMLYEGAGGTTAKELKNVLMIENNITTSERFSAILHSLEVSTPGTELHVGMKVFLDKEATPKQVFAKKIKDVYNATIDKIDFSNTSSAVTQINAWAKSVTRGHIEHLVSEADTKESTVLLLLNAVFFKGLWKNPFPSNNTQPGMFHTGPKTSVPVSYMLGDFMLMYVESLDLKAEIVRLPYMGDKYAMYIILPSNETTLEEVMAKMTPGQVRSLLDDMMQAPVEIALPKFSFEFASSLAPVLQYLGMKEMFSSGAQLNNIAEGPKDLVVSNVIQKAAIEVNEQGTVASAVTSVELVNKFGMHTISLNVSRPFLFFIEDESSRTVIFVGKVMNPEDPGKPRVNAKPLQAPVPTAENPEQTTAAVPTSPPPVQPAIEVLGNRVGTIAPLDPFFYFDFQLAQGIGAVEKGNWISSPASIKSALGLLLEAASKNSALEICQVLRLPQDVTEARDKMRQFQKNLMKPAAGVDVKIGNRVMVRSDLGIQRKYKVLAIEHFSAATATFNVSEPLRTSNELNNWVKEQTNNYIPEIMKPEFITQESLLFLVSAVYFKGDWKYPFNPHMTHDSCFYKPVCKRVQMMFTTGTFKSGEIPYLNAHIVELPYMNPRYSLVVLLPKERNGLNRLIWDLPFNPIISILDSLPPTDMDLSMPKFSINSGEELLPILQRFGLIEVFSDNADLSNLLLTKGKVSSFLHRAKIDVNEKGTKAGAATVINIQLLSSSYKPRLDIDRPFFFFIRDTESGILFEGQVTDPATPEVGRL